MIRIADILFSLIGLILLSPFLLLLSLAIVVESRGGVFYRQWRVGKGNTDFRIYKFRTMRPGSDKNGLLTIGEDSRITRIGYWIRKYKLDELAQLLNVLIGDMSLVGPRPEVRKYVDLYDRKQLEVLTVRPGITDYASLEYKDESQVLKKAENPEKTYVEIIMPHKLKLNMRYINKPSLIHYFKIIFLTIKEVLT